MIDNNYDLFKKNLINRKDADPNAGWLLFPHQHELQPQDLSLYRTRINDGTMLGNGFTAQIRDGQLYVKYTGDL